MHCVLNLFISTQYHDQKLSFRVVKNYVYRENEKTRTEAHIIGAEAATLYSSGIPYTVISMVYTVNKSKEVLQQTYEAFFVWLQFSPHFLHFLLIRSTYVRLLVMLIMPNTVSLSDSR